MHGLTVTEQGLGRVEAGAAGYRLVLPGIHDQRYHNAQITDYRSRAEFKHSRGTRLSVTCAAEGGLSHGTAGFGFWNHPFAPGERGFRLPRAAWFFFASRESNLALALGVPGHGWKAATMDAQRPLFFALLPTAPLSFLLMRQQRLYRTLWPIGQRSLGVDECLLDTALLSEPHHYALEWDREGVRFSVDEHRVCTTRSSPQGQMGFIAWIDNQFAVVTPQGRFQSGLISPTDPQSLTLSDITIDAF